MDSKAFEKMDIFIALSFINTKLRDDYKSLSDLCYDLNLEMEMVIKRFKSIDYNYNSSLNQFKAI